MWENIVDKLNMFTHWRMTITAGIVNIVAVVGYVLLTKGLEKPANMQEAVIFLFDYSPHYVPAIILGLIAKLLPVVFLIGAVGGAVNWFDGESEYAKYTRREYLLVFIVDFILFIISLVAAYFYVKYLGSLIWAIIIIIGIIYVLLNYKKS